MIYKSTSEGMKFQFQLQKSKTSPNDFSCKSRACPQKRVKITMTSQRHLFTETTPCTHQAKRIVVNLFYLLFSYKVSTNLNLLLLTLVPLYLGKFILSYIFWYFYPILFGSLNEASKIRI